MINPQEQPQFNQSPLLPQQPPFNGPEQPQQPPFNPQQQPPLNGPQPGLPGFNQQQNFPPQQGIDQQRPPDIVHEHPLNYIPSTNLACSICKQNINNQPGYKCDQCPIGLCMNCSNRVFFGQKKANLHPHPLNLRFQNEWRCNVCNILYKENSIFYCQHCNFGICASCYVPY